MSYVVSMAALPVPTPQVYISVRSLFNHDLPERGFSEENQQVAIKGETVCLLN
jgi:hypothetical protein